MAIAVVGCASSRISTEKTPVVEPTWVERAEPTIVAMATPARFFAPLPSSEAELLPSDEGGFQWEPVPTLRVLAPERYPPFSAIRHALANGDPDMQGRVVAALTRAASDGGPTERLVDFYVHIVQLALNPRVCAWLAEVEIDPASKAAQGVIRRVLPECRETVSALMMRAETPDELVFTWLSHSLIYGTRHEWSDRFERVVFEVAQSSADLDRVWDAGRIVASIDGDRGIEVVGRMAERLEGTDRRALVLAAMVEHDTEAGRSIGRHSCQVLSDPPDRAARRCLGAAESPESRDADAWEECVLTGLKQKLHILGPWTRCLERLAALDRPRAAYLAARIMRATHPDGRRVATGYSTDGAIALARFPVAGDLELVLDGLGLSDRGRDPTWLDRDATVPVTAAGILEARGRLVRLECESAGRPDGHDDLALSIIRAVRPILDDVRFIHEPAPDGASQLHAFMGGKRYSVTTGEMVGPELIGLLNVLLDERMSPERLVWGGECDVIAGPVPALHTLVERGILHVSR